MITVGTTKNGVISLINKTVNGSEDENTSNGEQTAEETKTSYQELVAQIRNVINNGGEDLEDEQVQAKYNRKIQAKLSSGQPLTQKEKSYLRKYNPELYKHVVRIELKRKMVENQLKHCKSKEEANRIQEQALSSIGENDPDRQYLISAVNYTMAEFKKTDSYNDLPETDEEAKKYKNNHENKLKTEEDRKKDEGEDEGEGQFVQYNASLGSYQESFTINSNTVTEAFNSLS